MSVEITDKEIQTMVDRLMLSQEQGDKIKQSLKTVESLERWEKDLEVRLQVIETSISGRYKKGSEGHLRLLDIYDQVRVTLGKSYAL